MCKRPPIDQIKQNFENPIQDEATFLIDETNTVLSPTNCDNANEPFTTLNFNTTFSFEAPINSIVFEIVREPFGINPNNFPF